MDFIETKHTPEHQSAQLGRIIAAAAHVSQARLLVLQERRETLSGRKARLLGTVADSLEVIVGPMQRIARAMQPETQSDSAAGAL